MATANHVLLRRTTLTATAASVTLDLTGVTGYTDLKIVASARSTANGGQNMNLTFNSTTSGYSDKILSGNGSAASSFTSGNTARGGSGAIPGADFTANTFGNCEIYIPNYRSSNPKSFSSDSVTENNATTAYNQMEATLWNNTTAISTILIDLSGGSFAAGSSFAIYGIANAATTPVSAPKADGGDIIKTDGTYWYHAFLSTGTFKPQLNLTTEAIVIGGGGGGGGDVGGGGGSGRVYGLTSLTMTAATNYVCTVGAGAVGGTNSAGPKGNDSSLIGGALSYTALGGGAGNARSSGPAAANDGWSGGGAGYDAVRPATSGNGGYAGGATYSPNSPPTRCGGGGGAGGAAAAATLSGGFGGVGVNTYSTWASATGTGVSGYYGGGGGGAQYGDPSQQATGGSGGGGTAGGQYLAGSPATANTGSGGGGGGSSTTSGGAGGSGIIIIRYPV